MTMDKDGLARLALGVAFDDQVNAAAALHRQIYPDCAGHPLTGRYTTMDIHIVLADLLLRVCQESPLFDDVEEEPWVAIDARLAAALSRYIEEMAAIDGRDGDA